MDPLSAYNAGISSCQEVMEMLRNLVEKEEQTPGNKIILETLSVLDKAFEANKGEMR